ncbi:MULTISPECIES: hypothetical protein [Hymenobacter]|uniref:Uncharacterized protein n=1 Tax=Hymenobacter jejuensis TaxID=2502781 RepID=A0A5B7ZVE8_9BACT|nr:MULTISPECIES: hypothetical protein [Hymenobacter]MBC6988877.1 hypothetical protein [Hymenobacter sp. BT491]QDA58817.1 hypothetical protein FHG12_01300 [Hymenobacter jejuensis]
MSYAASFPLDQNTGRATSASLSDAASASATASTKIPFLPKLPSTDQPRGDRPDRRSYEAFVDYYIACYKRS